MLSGGFCYVTPFLRRYEQMSTHSRWGADNRPMNGQHQSPSWWNSEFSWTFVQGVDEGLLTGAETIKSHSSMGDRLLSQAGNLEHSVGSSAGWRVDFLGVSVGWCHFQALWLSLLLSGIGASKGQLSWSKRDSKQSSPLIYSCGGR